MIRMRAFALGASLVAMSGCSLFWGLDGLQGGGCEGGACVEGGASPDDASSDLTMPPPDSGAASESGPGPDTGPREASGDESSGPGDAHVDSHDAQACTPATPPTLDDCSGIVALPAPPVIDGVLDCGVPLWPMPLQAWSGSSPPPSTVEAKLGIAWRPDGLYFFVRVTGLGPTRYPPPPSTDPWCGDAIELFIDNDGMYANPPLYDDPGTIQVIAEAPSDTMTSISTGATYRDGTEIAPWTGQYTVVRTNDDFDGEAFIVASDLGLSSWSLALNGEVGMDVAIDLGDPAAQTSSCPRLGQFTIQDPDTDASCSVAACNVYEFCSPQLVP